MYIRDFKYTSEDVDCQFCVEFANNRCRVNKCPWMKERVEAGVISYIEAVSTLFSARSSLSKRAKVALSHTDKTIWRDEAHHSRFNQADASFGFYKRRNTSEYYAALFLLTSEETLFRRVSTCFKREGIDFSSAKLRDIPPEHYALFKIAKSLYTDSPEVSVDELANPELVSAESFRLVINAMLVRRYGLPALKLKRKDGCSGSI